MCISIVDIQYVIRDQDSSHMDICDRDSNQSREHDYDKLTIISGLSKQIHLGLKLTSLQILQQSFSPKRGPSRCIICIFKTTVIIIINIIVITLTYLDCCECHHYLQSFKRCYSTTRRYIRDLSLHFLLPCLVLQLPESDLTLIYH